MALVGESGVGKSTLLNLIAGLGVALMREDLAVDAAAAGSVCLWRDVRATTTLSFLHLRERGDDPVVHALTDLVRDVWTPAGAPRATAALPVGQASA